MYHIVHYICWKRLISEGKKGTFVRSEFEPTPGEPDCDLNAAP